MKKVRIFILILAALFAIKCTNSTSTDSSKDKEVRLEYAQYAIENSEVSIYTGCNTFRDSVVREAEILAEHFSYMDSSFAFNRAKFENIIDSNIYDEVKRNSQKRLSFTIGIILFLLFSASLLLIYLLAKNLFLNRANKVKSNDAMSMLKKTILAALFCASGIIIWVIISNISSTVDKFEIRKQSIDQYFIHNSS